MAIDAGRIAAAFRGLAELFEEQAPTAAQTVATSKPRGRPPKGETPPAAPAAQQPTVTDDPFATPAAPAVPTATIEEVRTALTKLKDAVSQEYALKILKDASGVDNLTALLPAKYGAVVEAVKSVMTERQKPQESDDPFALPGETQPEKPLTLEDVKAVVVETQKRTAQDAAQKVVMQHGGKAKNPQSGQEGPSLKALPAANYAACVAALKALPSTK